MLKKLLSFFVCVTTVSVLAGISNLRGEFRNGQLFLRWDEDGLEADTRLSVWSSDQPITADNISKAKRVAVMLNLNSARDWWLDISSFLAKRSKTAKSEEIFAGNVSDSAKVRKSARGFVITPYGKPISPDGGLHVHTPKAGETGKRYYAIACHKGSSDKILSVVSTAKPIKVAAGKANPIPLSGKWEAGKAKGLPLLIALHGRGGGVGVDRRGNPVGNHIIFVDSSLAWREGIPFKFTVSISGGVLRITLCDRIWAGRRLTRKESGDSRDYVPAIATFWMGYNTNIAYSNRGPEFRFDNYTERYILHIIRWAQDHLGADKNRTYITGGSMGGSGTVQMVTHFPEVFAAGLAYVPVYSYTWKKSSFGNNSAFRLTCSGGLFTGQNPARMPDGTDLLEYADGARNINRPALDMPPLLATNGRNDSSIPWVNNPPFYKAANEARQMFSVFWNNGPHGMSRQAPKDCATVAELFRYKLNESFPAFSNNSDNRNYGNGSHTDGDLIGWINRGTNWKDVTDTAERYEISLAIAHPEIKYPVTSDVTIRRRQNFKFAAGTKLKVSVNGKTSTVTIDKNGLLTIPGIVFPNADFVKVVVTR